MATIVNNTPPVQANTRNGNGFLIGVLLLFVLAILLFVYGLPYLRANIGASTAQINVPDHVNVNVQHTK